MEHNFANIKTAFDFFLSTLVLKDQSQWRANKSKQGTRGEVYRCIMLIRMFVLKVINNERKVLTRHEIINCIAEQILLVLTRVYKEWMSSSELTTVRCLIHLFIQVHLLLLCRCMDLKKGFFINKIRNHSQPLNPQQHITILHKFT